jgi:basic membrane lipoprotein Med (substrate-binding protein (PBP1-ABC) superfamily)
MIGVDSPMMWFGTDSFDDPFAATGPTFGLTSMLKRVDVACFSVISDVYDGTLDPTSGAIVTYNLENGGHDWEIGGLYPFSNVTETYTLVPYDPPLLEIRQDWIDLIEDLKADIIDGTVTIPDTIYWT